MARQPTPPAPAVDPAAPPADGETSSPATPPPADPGGDKPEPTAVAVARAIKLPVLARDAKGRPVERQATAGDILSFRADGAAVVAVTTDGRKHRLEIDR